jgi:hypothetical protein
MSNVITTLVEQWEYKQRWKGYQRCMMLNKRGQIAEEQAKRAARRLKHEAALYVAALELQMAALNDDERD